MDPRIVDNHLKTLKIMKLIFFVSWRMMLYGSQIFSHTQLMRLALIRNDESFPPGHQFSVSLCLCWRITVIMQLCVKWGYIMNKYQTIIFFLHTYTKNLNKQL